MKNVKSIVKRSAELFNNAERSNMDHLWSDIAEFILPNASGIFRNNKDGAGEKKTRRIYDSTAIQANHDLAAAIHSTLTNPTSKWSRVRFKDEELNNNEEAVRWLEDANNRLHTSFNESNFDTEVSRNYMMYPSLGTMVLFHEERQDDRPLQFEGHRFKSVHLSEVAFAEGPDGNVDIVFRKFKMSLDQMIKRWGSELSPDLLERANSKPDDKIEILHAVFARKESEVKLNSQGLASGDKRPIASMYIELETNGMLEEGGFYEFPYYVTRWSTMPGEVYGRSPGFIALNDVRTLNTLKKLTLEGVAKAINPPMLATERSVLGNLDLRPSKLSFVRELDGIKEFRTDARFDVSNFTAKELQDQIKTTFFLDKLLLPPRTETGEMTATEVLQRLEQMQKVLGSTLSRLNSEFLSPLIIRSFKMMLRGGAFLPLPSILEERGIDIEISFVNSLARAQQVEDVNTINGWLQNIGMIAQFKPEVLDLVNADGIAKHLATIRGVPEIAIRSDEEVAQLRQAQAQAAQQQEQMNQAMQAADIASKTGGLQGGT